MLSSRNLTAECRFTRLVALHDVVEGELAHAQDLQAEVARAVVGRRWWKSIIRYRITDVSKKSTDRLRDPTL